MILIEAWFEGTMPLLQHRLADGALDDNGTRKNVAAEREDPRVTAEKGVYRLPSRQIAMTGAALSRMLREAGGAHKMRGSRKSLKYAVPAAVVVMDELAGLYLRDRKTPVVDFEVDSRPVVIPATKGRVMRHRARFNEWAVKFTLRINETILAESVVRGLAVEGSQQIGLGDFRPEKGGPFGVSDLVAWDVVSDAKSKTAAQKRNGEARV